jgi:hypothetical protein
MVPGAIWPGMPWGEAFRPSPRWKPPADDPPLRSVEEVESLKAKWADEIPGYVDEARDKMELLLRKMQADHQPYDGHDVGELPDDYIIAPVPSVGLPYIRSRVNGLDTKWEECETVGHALDFISRFMKALPNWQKGYLQLGATKRNEALARVKGLDRLLAKGQHEEK